MTGTNEMPFADTLVDVSASSFAMRDIDNHIVRHHPSLVGLALAIVARNADRSRSAAGNADQTIEVEVGVELNIGRWYGHYSVYYSRKGDAAVHMVSLDQGDEEAVRRLLRRSVVGIEPDYLEEEHANDYFALTFDLAPLSSHDAMRLTAIGSDDVSSVISRAS